MNGVKERIKMKYRYSYIIIWSLIVFALWYIVYPGLLSIVESESFFVATPDFFRQKLSFPGGLGEFCADFVSQVFRWKEAGAAIFAIMSLIIIGGTCSACRFVKLSNALTCSLFIGILFSIVQLKGFTFAQSMQITFFFAAIWLYASLKNKRLRIIVVAGQLPLMIWLLPPLLSGGFFLLLAALEFLKEKTIIFPALFLLVSPVLAFTVPPIWNNYIAFAFLEETNHSPYIFISVTVIIVIVFGFLPQIKKNAINAVISLLVILAGTVWMIQDKPSHEKEYMCRIETYASAGYWNELIESIPIEKVHDNPLLMRYLLLAYSETGQLPNQLTSMLPLNTNDFYFRPATTPAQKRFNALFYSSIGLYNEAMHQAFEYGILSYNWITFGCMRDLIDWNLKVGNSRIAKKYLTVLSHSTYLGDWVKSREELLLYLKEHPVDNPNPNGEPAFAGSQSFVTEMGHLVNQGARNPKIIDYLLCSLILKNDKARFEAIFNGLHYEELRKEVPELYKAFLSQTVGVSR